MFVNYYESTTVKSHIMPFSMIHLNNSKSTVNKWQTVKTEHVRNRQAESFLYFMWEIICNAKYIVYDADRLNLGS